MNKLIHKLIHKLIVAIDNSHYAKVVLSIVFILSIIIGSYKLDSILRHWLG